MSQLLGNRRTADLVYDWVRGRVVAGALGAGERIDQDLIAQELGVSRTPIREALVKLEAEGFVSREPYRGVTVAKTDGHEVDELTALRLNLEGLGAEYGAVNVSAEDLTVMSKALTLLGEFRTDGDHDRFAQVHERFHATLYAASGSPKLIHFVKTLGLHATRIRLFHHFDGSSIIAEQHEAILAACEAHDGAAARIATRAHIVGVLLEMARQSQLGIDLEHLNFTESVLTDDERKQIKQGGEQHLITGAKFD